MAWPNDLRPQVRSARNGRVEVADFKPEEHAISMGEVWVADGAVMMLDIPTVQLKNQPAVRNKSLILGAAMIALAAEESLIPATARLDVAHANQGLWIHRNHVNSSSCQGSSARAICTVSAHCCSRGDDAIAHRPDRARTAP
jgi:hypothetical protein